MSCLSKSKILQISMNTDKMPTQNLEDEGESSNRDHDVVPPKGLFRQLRRSTCSYDHKNHKQSTTSIHNLYSQSSFRDIKTKNIYSE